MAGAKEEETEQEPHHEDCPLADPRVTNPRAQGMWCECRGIYAREQSWDEEPPEMFAREWGNY